MSGSSTSAGQAIRTAARTAARTAILVAVLAGPLAAPLHAAAGAVAQAPGLPLDLVPAPRRAQPAQPSLEAEPLPPPLPAAAAPWRGIPDATLRALAPALPEASPSLAVRSLLRRLLALSPGERGAGEPDFGRLRFAKLLAAGAGEAAAALAAASPGLLDDPDAAGAWTDRLLLAGDVDAACARKLLLPPAAAIRLPVLCLASSGRPEEVALAVGLLREQGGADPLFLALADTLAGLGGGALPDVPGGPDAIHLAMMRLADLPAPSAAFGTREPARLAALARMEANGAADRVSAAERAAAAGGLDAAGLAAVYRAAAASDADGGRGRLYADALAAGGAARERLVARAVARLPGPMLAGPVGTVWADLLEGAPDGGPSSSPAAAREQEALARLLLAQGRPAAFARLDRLARLDAPAAARLWPLAAIGGGGLGDGARLEKAGLGLSAWLDVAIRDDAGAAARILALFEALGEPVPRDAWLAALDAGRAAVTLPSAALLRQLRDADPAGSPDGILLAALAALGDAAPAELPAAVLGPVLRGLRSAGFEAQARDLAREAALTPADG